MEKQRHTQSLKSQSDQWGKHEESARDACVMQAREWEWEWWVWVVVGVGVGVDVGEGVGVGAGVGSSETRTGSGRARTGPALHVTPTLLLCTVLTHSTYVGPDAFPTCAWPELQACLLNETSTSSPTSTTTT